MNSFFASCEQQENPELRGQPVAVVPSMAMTTCCLAASYEAKKFGIKTGVLLRDAKKMCPDIRFIKAHHSRYTQYHQKIAEVIESCIHVKRVCSIDEFAVQLTGSDQKPEKATLIAQEIKQKIAQKVGESLTCSIGISANRLLAKIAADMQKPNGLTVIQKSEIFEKLKTLKLQDIPGIGRKTEYRLQSQGVYTMEQLLRCSEAEMRKLWGGIWGERLFHWLKGEDFELEETKTSSLSHQHVLPPKLRSYAGAYDVSKELLQKTARRLRRKGYFAKRLSVQIKLLGEGKSNLDFSVKFHETQDLLFLLKELEYQWKAFPKIMRPLRVSVVLSDLVPVETHQLSFFENKKTEKLSEVLDQLQRKMGTDKINFGAFFLKSACPENYIAFQHIPERDEDDELDELL